MKSKQKSLIFPTIVIFVLICLILTNPNRTEQKEKIKTKIILLKTNEMNNEYSESISNEVVKAINEDIEIHILSDNYVFFSIVKGVWKGEYVILGVGTFKNIIWRKNINDTFEKYFLNKSEFSNEKIPKLVVHKNKNQEIINNKEKDHSNVTDVENEDILGAKLLFKGVRAKLSITDKMKIFKLLEFKMSKFKNKFIFDNQDDNSDPSYGAFEASVTITDMNKDNIFEVFVTYGNLYTSGMSGQSVVLFIKSDDQYEMNLNFPGYIGNVVVSKDNEYLDLLIACPGMGGTPLWKWNGNKYDFDRKVSSAEFDLLPKKELNDIAIKY